MNKLLLLGLAGGAAWWFFFRKKPVVPPVTGGPAETTGAPQPQGVQAYPRAISNVYDLSAFPMGSFVNRR